MRKDYMAPQVWLTLYNAQDVLASSTPGGGGLSENEDPKTGDTQWRYGD